MKNKLFYIVKYSKITYFMYYHFMSFVVWIIGCFVKRNDKLILFNSFGGKKYDDNPKAIYDEMIKDMRFKDYRLVWAFQESNKIIAPIETVKCDTFRYFKMALSAKMWITNSSMERGLKFKKKKTICFNTWHGTAIKKMGCDIINNQSFRSELSADIMLAQSQYDIDVFSHAFNIPVENFRLIGLPRNDELVNYTQDRVDRIRKTLNILSGKRILLYAPTFREYTKGKNKEVIINMPINLDKWQKTLGNDYIVLFRAHYEVAKYMDFENYSVFVDVSKYECLADLMILSDALITDYSSICFDYSIMQKPIYCFAYDYEEYISKRGTYLELVKELPCMIHHDESSLLKDIIHGDFEKNYKEKVIEFQKKYALCNGNASRLSCDIIYELLQR